EGVAEVGHGVGEGDRGALGDHQGQAAGHRQHGQRGDERREFPVRHEDAVDQAGGDAGGDGQQHREDHGDARGGGAPGEHGGGQGGDRADRQVDARGDDDEGDTEGEDRDDRRLDADVEQVVGGQEVTGQRRHGDDQDD